MKKYRVNYIVKTHSRYGTYIYKAHDFVEAENEEQAAEMMRNRSAENTNNGQNKLIVKSVREIA